MKTTLRFVLVLLVLLPAVLLRAQDDLTPDIEAFIAEISPADGPAVAARITIGDETRAAAGGRVDVSRDETATPDSRFRIASMSKTFLAVAVMQLQEQGVLALDDPITNWLPEDVTGRLENADSVTIFQLLTMTSGLAEYLADDFYNAIFDDPHHRWTALEVLEFAYEQPALFAPGEGFEYTNTNYILLQLIVEAATGKPMHEVMREQIFAPIGLEATCVHVYEEQCSPTVRGYEDFDGDGTDDDVTDVNDGAGLGDGALVSTTADLTRFYQALFIHDELLSEESVQMMVDAADNENEYGIGLEVTESDYGVLMGHTGSVMGFSGAVYYAPDLDAIVVMLYGSQGLEMEHITGLLAIAAGEAE